MPTRNSAPFTFTGRTLSDTTDATMAARGVMRSLANLLADPTTPGAWYCRPAAVTIQDFTAEFDHPTQITALREVGDIAYGMVSTARFPGKDEPFAYDAVARVFLPLTGVADPNTPDSPPETGEWTPPIVKRVGSRILVAHPGFSDGGVKFGWFDVSGFDALIQADYYAGVPFLYGGFSVLGVQPGMLIAGSVDIPASAVVVDVFSDTQSVNIFSGSSNGTDIIAAIPGADMVEMYPGKTVTGPKVQLGTTIVGTPTGASIQLSKPTTGATIGPFRVIGNIPAFAPYERTGDFVDGNPDILNTSIVDVHVGQLITSTHALPGTYVLSVTPPTTVTMTQGAVGTANTVAWTSAGAVLEISAAPTADGTGPLAIRGGTAEAPLWGAGDTAVNHLPSQPVGVGEMNGRAWYACGADGILFSDAFLACVISNDTAVQALVPGNGLPVTAIGELKLTSTTLGGNVQGLLAFQRDADIQQITGDPTTGNLQMVDLRCATGTHAPLTIVSTTKGTFFVSPQGLRLVGFSGQVSDPIGQDGMGVVRPFLNVTNPPMVGNLPPSRMCAAANGRTVRITVPQYDDDGAVAWAEYWYDMARNLWTGPHGSGACVIANWSDTFLLAPAPAGSAVELRQSDDAQNPSSTFVEGGLPMQWEWETSLLPDSGAMAENAVIESAIMVALPPGESVQVDFLDEVRQNLDGTRIDGLVVAPGYWGQADWGVTFIGPDPGSIRQRQVPWTRPLVFKQGSVNVRGNSSSGIGVGNFYMRYEILGYLLEVPQIPAPPFGGVQFLLANDGLTIIQANNRTNLSVG